MKKYHNTKQSAFTLIELMVVVAIIAILAVLGISGFSSAIRRARNSQRQSDIEAVSKSLETCYDALKGQYSTLAVTTGVVSISSTTTPSGPFLSTTDGCLTKSIQPTVANYDYSYDVKLDKGVQKFMLCAKLEKTGGWESVGNSTTAAAAGSTLVACTATGTDCYFCMGNQQ